MWLCEADSVGNVVILTAVRFVYIMTQTIFLTIRKNIDYFDTFPAMTKPSEYTYSALMNGK